MKPIGLAFSMPLVMFTRHVPHWPRPWQLRYWLMRGAEAVEALVDVDAGLDRLLAEIGAFGDFNFLVLFGELDKRHGLVRNDAVC